MMLRLPPNPNHTHTKLYLLEALVTHIEHNPQHNEFSILTVTTPYKTYDITAPLDCEDQDSGVYYFDDPTDNNESKALEVLDMVDLALERGDTDDDYSLINFEDCPRLVVHKPKMLRNTSVLHPFARLNPFLWRNHQFESLFEAFVFSMVRPDSITKYYQACNKVGFFVLFVRMRCFALKAPPFQISERESIQGTNYASHIVYREPEKHDVSLLRPFNKDREMWIGMWTSLIRAIYLTNEQNIKLALSAYSVDHFLYYEDPWVPSLVGGRVIEENGRNCFIGYNILGSLWMNLRREIL